MGGERPVKLAEALTRLPIEHLARIAMNCGIVCGTHSKRQLTRAILDNFRRPPFLKHVLDHWDEQERATLAYLLLSPPAFARRDMPIGLGGVALGAGLNAHHERRLERYSRTIRDHGFLLPRPGRSKEDVLWDIPDDLRETLKEVLLEEPETASAGLEGEPEQAIRGRQAFLEDLFTLLVLARKDTLRLTRSGTLFKRSWEHLERQLLIAEETIWIPLPEGYPDRLAFMLGFAKRQQMLCEKAAELVTTRNLERWMARAELDKYGDLYRYLRRSVVAGDPGCARILEFLEHQVGEGKWTPILEPIHACYGYFSGRPWWLPELQSRVYWLFHILMHLDFVALGRFSRRGEVAYRWLPRGDYFLRHRGVPPKAERPVRLTVQPDFEVFVADDVPLSARWRLEQIADLVSRDVVFRYRITRESVYRGLKWGVTLEAMLSFLRKASPQSLPQNVLHNLRTWAEQYGNISFADVLLMHCATEEIAQEIHLSPEFAPLIQGTIGQRDLIISRKDYARILRLLERSGYLPKPGIVTFGEEQ